MKIDRLLNIIVYLLNHGRTSAQKLADEFEVSPRTIMRDLESIELAGIPIQSFYGVDGGYQIMEEYVLEKQVATKYDYEWIAAALKGMISAYASDELEHALAKIERVKTADEMAVSMDFSVACEDERINEQLKLLGEAIKAKHVVQFLYTNSYDEIKKIQVEPVQLQYKWYNWYLIGYYEKYHDYCMFKLVRMDDLIITDIDNIKDHNISDIRFNNSDINSSIINIKLFGKAIAKSKCREYLNGQITKEYENGDFEFCFSVPEYENFWYGIVLSLGNSVKIMEPDEVRERILTTCKEIQEQYLNV